MANVIGQTVVSAVETREVRLARTAVSRLNGAISPDDKPQVVAALVARLREEKSRLPGGPNASEVHAQQAVQDLLEEVLEQAKRKAEVGAFIRANQGRALAYAEAILNNLPAAQDAVSQTYLELLEGKTTPSLFFRALKGNARNMRRRMSWEIEHFESAEKVFDPRHLPGEDGMAGGESITFSLEPASSRLEDQDPLDQMIDREEQAARGGLVQAAMKDPRWRYIKLREWAAPLRKECAESGPSWE